MSPFLLVALSLSLQFLSSPPYPQTAAFEETPILPSYFSRLSGIPEAEDLASQMLKGFPRDRVSAQEALTHDYFRVLPSQLYQLPDGKCVRAHAHSCARASASNLILHVFPQRWRIIEFAKQK